MSKKDLAIRKTQKIILINIKNKISLMSIKIYEPAKRDKSNHFTKSMGRMQDTAQTGWSQ